MKKSLFYAGISAVIFAAAPFAARACTSWMVFSDLTKNNTNILHKNRDSKSTNVAAFVSKPDAKRKWVALNNTDAGVNAGVNTSGLAGVMNSGERCIDPPNVRKGGKDTTVIMRVILESCDTAKQAVAKLEEIIKSGDYHHGESGSTFFFCDINEGYVCELTYKHVSSQRFDRGYTVRANIWQNPNMYELSRSTLLGHLHSSARAYMALSMLNQAIDTNKKVTVADSFAISRHHQMPENSPMKRSLCGKTTNSGVTIEIDREYPEVLSVLFATIGPPRNTLYIPIPVCAEKLHPAMGDHRWSNAAWKHFEKNSFSAPIPEAWSKFETDAVAKFAAAKAEARKLLKSGKRAEAIALINATAETIWKNAAALLGI